MAAGEYNESDSDEALEEEARNRITEARELKALWTADMMESYFFSAPHRLRFMQSETKPSNARMNDMRELQTSIGYLVTTDFVTEVINTFLPEAQRWCERGRGMVMPEEVWDKLAKDVRKQDEQIFEAIKASNFYPEIAKAFNPDLAVGTIGLFVEQRRAHEPITVLSVPLRELEVNLGPDGMIDDRFMVRWTRNCYVKALLPDAATVSDEDWQDIKEHPKDRTRITWGYWRKWDETDEVWQHTIMLKDKLVHSAVLRGAGCCPLIVGRFNPSADWVWGIGPLIQGIPDLCQIDELEMQKLKNVELHLDPPVAFPNDSMMMIEQGLEAGRAYPITPGTGQDIKAIYQPQSPEVGIYEHQDLEHRLRKLFFVDHPEQTGDTPPTLGQWLDEMARMQRRLGTPGMSFWREICAPTFLRYQYLLEKVRAIEPIVVNGTVVSLRPYNPTQRAAEQQEIALAAQFAQMMSQMFPEEWKMAVDGRLTMEAFMNKMRVDGLIKFRDPKQVQQFVQQMQPLLQASQRASSGVAQAGGNGAAAPVWRSDTGGRHSMNEPEITPEMLRDGLDEIARTRPGMLLYRYLQKELLGVATLPIEDPEGALRHHHGRRTLALELMSLMTKGINASGGPNSTERPVVFRQSEPAARTPFRGAGRRTAAWFDSNTDPTDAA